MGRPNGQLTLQANGQFTYMPNDGFVGIDSFTYLANDGTDTTLAQVDISVIGIPTSPTLHTASNAPAGNHDDTGSTDDNKRDDTSDVNSSDDNGPGSDTNGDDVDSNDETVVPVGISDLVKDNKIPVLDLRDAPAFEVSSNDVKDLTQALTDENRARSVLRSLLQNFSHTDGIEQRAQDQLDRVEFESGFYSAFDAEYLFAELNELENNNNVDLGKFEMTVGAVTAVGTIGYILWALRGGTLLALALSQLPAWQMIDPLPILESYESGDDHADENDSDDLNEFFS